MAQKRYTIDGYGQVELNNVAFRRDGRIEAQCALNGTAFANKNCENGMLLVIDNITRTIKLHSSSASNEVIGLVYSAEHEGNDTKKGLKNFKLAVGDVLPRLGLLAVGDKFTTNCVSYDPAVDSTWTTDAKFEESLTKTALATTPIYGGVSADGSILVSATAPQSGIILKVVQNISSMPDGQFGIQFQVVAL